MSSLFLSIKDVQTLTGLQCCAAQRKLAKVRQQYKIPKYEPVPIVFYCRFYRQDVMLAIQFLEQKQHKTLFYTDDRVVKQMAN